VILGHEIADDRLRLMSLRDAFHTFETAADPRSTSILPFIPTPSRIRCAVAANRLRRVIEDIIRMKASTAKPGDDILARLVLENEDPSVCVKVCPSAHLSQFGYY
jgi:cytochrome P450